MSEADYLQSLHAGKKLLHIGDIGLINFGNFDNLLSKCQSLQNQKYKKFSHIPSFICALSNFEIIGKHCDIIAQNQTK